MRINEIREDVVNGSSDRSVDGYDRDGPCSGALRRSKGCCEIRRRRAWSVQGREDRDSGVARDDGAHSLGRPRQSGYAVAVTIRTAGRAVRWVIRAIGLDTQLRSAAAGNVFDDVDGARHMQSDRQHQRTKREERHAASETGERAPLVRTRSVRWQRHDCEATSFLQSLKCKR